MKRLIALTLLAIATGCVSVHSDRSRNDRVDRYLRLRREVRLAERQMLPENRVRALSPAAQRLHRKERAKLESKRRELAKLEAKLDAGDRRRIARARKAAAKKNAGGKQKNAKPKGAPAPGKPAKPARKK